MNYKVLLLFFATGCFSLSLGLIRINPPVPEYQPELIIKEVIKKEPEQTIKPKNKSNVVVSSNVIIVYPKMNHHVSISSEQMDKLVNLYQEDPKKVQQITSPTHKITDEEIAAIIKDSKTMLASLKKKDQ